jgi:hypothetical protein
MIKLLIKQTPIYAILKEYLFIKSYWQWLKEGKPSPPPHIVKQMIVKEYSYKYNCPIFFETGTYKGDMVFSVRKNFEKIYTVELSEQLHKDAKNRFKRYKHITLLHGDSGDVVPETLKEIKKPCLFWLDGHYSAGDTVQSKKKSPIEDEIAAILAHDVDNHVILIDDAREFVGLGGYPKLDEFIKFVIQTRVDLSVSVECDIIRIHKS